MTYTNLRCGVMPSHSGVSENQGIELIKFV